MHRVLRLQNHEVEDGSLADLGQKHATVWVDLADPEASELGRVADHIGISVEEIKRFLAPQSRPFLEDVGEFTVVIFHAPELENATISLRPHVLFVSKEQKDLISLHLGKSAAGEKFIAYSPGRKSELFGRGSTALLFAILSEMVNGGFAVLDYISEEIGKLEEQVFQPRLSVHVMKKIFHLKKNLIYLQRALAADREVVSEIEKSYGQFLDQRQVKNFRILYGDIAQLIELATTYRDIIMSSVEVHLAAISNNLNVVMKRLTAWAAIILVPSLIAGIYGMNFAFLPFAQHPTGFWYALGIMAVSIWGLYSYFKAHDWI